LRNYSEEIKSAMVAKLARPYSISAMALSQEVGIPHQTLCRWVKEYGKRMGK